MPNATVEECPRIDACELVRGDGGRSALEGSGGPRGGVLIGRDRSGHRVVAIRYVAQGGAVELTHLHGLIPGRGVRCRAAMELVQGDIAFFRCPGPGCGRRVRHLYLQGGDLRCRHCHHLIYTSRREGPSFPSPADGASAAGQGAEGEELTPREMAEAEVDELIRKKEQAGPERERLRRRRYVQRTGHPGRPREKRHYSHDSSRKVKLGPREAYCCRCRKAVPYRYPRRTEVWPQFDEITDEIEVRVAIRARCPICNTPVFRIVRPEEAEGLQGLRI